MSLDEVRRNLEKELERMQAGGRSVSTSKAASKDEFIQLKALWKGREEGIQRALQVVQAVRRAAARGKMGPPQRQSNLRPTRTK